VFHYSSHPWAPILPNPQQLAHTMGLTRLSFVRATTFQSTTKFLPGSRWFLGSLEFLTDKIGNLSLQKLELGKVTGLGTDCFPPSPVWVILVNEAQLRHGLGSLGEADTNPTKDKANHPLAILTAATDPICPSSSKSDSQYGREVYIVE
jgi:hypothetical protein